MVRHTLRAGRLGVELVPELGGSITRFRLMDGDRSLDVLRPSAPHRVEQGDVLATSCFPLVPYSGRIRDARLTFRGRTYEVPRTVASEPNALHGDGWQRPWSVERADARSIILSLDGANTGWPFPYRAVQTFALTSEALDAEVSLTNMGNDSMPAGIGLHPWFTATPGVRLRTAADEVWTTDERHLFCSIEAIPERWDFRDGRALAGTELCHGLTGWQGRAELEWPETGLRLAMTASASLGHLVVYAPPDQDFFCVEPVSHSVDAFNLESRGVPGNGTVVLAPGETLIGHVRFAPEATSDG